MKELEAAWRWRLRNKILPLDAAHGAARVFHGRDEGAGALRDLTIDLFGAHAWVTWRLVRADQAGAGAADGVGDGVLQRVSRFLSNKGVSSAVVLKRPKKGLPGEPTALFGAPPSVAFAVRENKMEFLVRMLGTRHPGLFLDHGPLRRLLSGAGPDAGPDAVELDGGDVLNCFSYTGALSVAARAGGARHVTSVDLSRPSNVWAAENWKLNGFEPDGADFVTGDALELLPLWLRKGRRFDCVIADPPSFARGRKAVFSTRKNLSALAGMVFGLVAPGGMAVISVNTEDMAQREFDEAVRRGARDAGTRIVGLVQLRAPETFGRGAHLKGVVARV